jgi:cell division control protein 6
MSTPTKALSNIYAHARSLLRLSSETTTDQLLLGRKEERAALTTFLAKRFSALFPEHEDTDETADASASLYVSGMPGTGKTALLLETIARMPSGHDVQVDMVNCLSLKQPGDIWAHLIDEEVGSGTKADALRELAEEHLARVGPQRCV